MGKHTELLAAFQFLWELARFLGLFALALLRFRGAVSADPAAGLWLLALGSAQLLVPALLALFLYSPDRRAALLPFLRLAKVLQLFPVLLLVFALLLGPGAWPPGPLWLRFMPLRALLSAALLAASLVDLLFLALLAFAAEAGARARLR